MEYGFTAYARNNDGIVTVSGPITTIYTLRENVAPYVNSTDADPGTGDMIIIFSEPVIISMKDIYHLPGCHTLS